MEAVDEVCFSSFARLCYYGVESHLFDLCQNGKTPLHSAADFSNVDFAKMLIAAKANCNAQDVLPMLMSMSSKTHFLEKKKGCTPIHVAAAKGSKSILVALIKAKADINIKNSVSF